MTPRVRPALLLGPLLLLGVASRAAAHGSGPIALSDGDRLAIARLLCESATVARRGAELACGTCPSYTERAGDAGDHRLAAFYPGHFSGPAADEVVVEMRGACESGASSGQTYGGHAMVRRTRDGWQRTFYEAGGLGECTAIRGTTRSRLVCRRRAGHMGLLTETFTLVAYDDAAGRTDEQDGAVLQLFSHSLAAAGPSPKEPANVLAVTRYALRGQHAYEAGDEHALSIELNVRSRVDCPGGPGGCPGVDTATRDTPLRYVFDGTAFHLAPESQGELARLEPRNRE
jgi:hypothetical protein